MQVEINRINRIYASLDKRNGTIYKVKSEFRRDKLANAPDHSIVDNANKININDIDKSFYINVALKRISEFKGDQNMADEIKKTKGKKARKEDIEIQTLTYDEVDTAELIKSFEEIERLDEKIELQLKENDQMLDNTPMLDIETMNKIKFNQKMMKMQQFFDSYDFVIDGYNESQKYKYIKASQYKIALRKACIECGLRFKVNIVQRLFQPLEKTEKAVHNENVTETVSNKMNLITIQGSIVLVDVETGYEDSYFTMADGADMLDKGLPKAQTMLIKAFVQMNFLIADGDEDYEGNTKENKKGSFVTDQKRDEIKNVTVATKKMATKQYLASILRMLKVINESDPTFGVAQIKMIESEIAKERVTIENEKAIALFMRIEEIMDERGLSLTESDNLLGGL